jgi:hypothetical protein
MSKEQTKQVTMNVPLRLWQAAEQLGRDLGYRDKRGVHTRILREIISAHVHRIRFSPYICRSARHVVFINRDGDMFHWQKEGLQLSQELRHLPCCQKMKPEKKKDFLQRRDPRLSEAEWFRSLWLINYFAAWNQGVRLSSWVDHEGTTAKKASLDIGQGPNRLVTREYLIGIRDYVQWRDTASGLRLPEADTNFDRIDLVQQIPTRNLSISVMVDTDLYRKTPFASEKEIPKLAAEFRNLEGTLFEDRSIAQDPENPAVEVSDSYIGQQPAPPKAHQMRDLLTELRSHITTVGAAEADNGPVLPDEGRQRLAESFQLPDHFLFYEFGWEAPQSELSVGVRWEKPVRLTPGPPPP